MNNFNRNFKTDLNILNSNVLQLFPNFDNGTFVLHSIFKVLLEFYSKFISYHQKRFQSDNIDVPPIALKYLVSELKKYKTIY